MKKFDHSLTFTSTLLFFLVFVSCNDNKVKECDDCVVQIGNLKVRTDFGQLPWKEAKKTCEELEGNWRLPNMEELKLIYENKEKYNLETQPNNFVWSSVPDPEWEGKIMGIRFTTGEELRISSSFYQNFFPVSTVK